MKRGFELSERGCVRFVHGLNRYLDSKDLFQGPSPPSPTTACGLCLLLPRSCCGYLLCFRFELDYHALQQKSTNKSRFAHHLIGRYSRALEDVMEQPRLAASDYQFFTTVS